MKCILVISSEPVLVNCSVLTVKRLLPFKGIINDDKLQSISIKESIK